MTRSCHILALSAVLVLSLAGCGVYSFSPSGTPDFKSVHVRQLESQTIEFQLADRLTQAIIDAFIKDNTVEVRDESQAEAVMQGSLVKYQRDPYTYDINDQVSEYVVKVTVDIKVVKAGTEDVFWEEEFYEEGIYKADTETEEDGQNRAIEQITADILDRTTKSW